MATPNYMDAALKYAVQGFRVFPLWEIIYREDLDASVCACERGADCGNQSAKHPRVKAWREVATTDEKQIRSWWRRWPSANIGLTLGEVGGRHLWALDIDGEEGRAALARIEAQHGALPKTLTVNSGGGGEHRIFAASGPVGNAPVAPRLDVRADGGYLVAPPSLHLSLRRYAWVDEGTPIAHLERDALPFKVDAKKQKSRELPPHGLLGDTAKASTKQNQTINQDEGEVKDQSAPTAHKIQGPARLARGTGSTSGGQDLPPNPTPSRQSGDTWAARVLFARKALEIGAGEVRGAAEGERRTTLNAVGFRLGRFVGAGALSRSYIEGVLRDAATASANPLPDGEISSTILAALNDGERDPHPFDGVGTKAGKTRPAKEGERRDGVGEREGEGKAKLAQTPREREPGEDDDDKEGPAWLAELPPVVLPSPSDRATPAAAGPTPPLSFATRAAMVRNRPHIVLDGDDEDKLYTVLPLIEKINQKSPEIFLCGREVKRIVRDREQRMAQTVEPVHLKVLLQKHFSFQKVTYNKDGEEQHRPTNLPPSLAEHLLHQPELDFPPLEEVVRQPFVSTAGEIVMREGYDRGMAAWLDLGGLVLPPVPQNPTKEQVGAAVEFFFSDFLGDFPFADEASRANTLALALLPFVRQVVDGPTPLHIVTAPAAGSGKSKLVEVIALATTGQSPTSLAPVDDDGEWRKRITSTLAGLPTYTLIDNLSPRHLVDSPSFAKALTDNQWTDRILGGSDNATYNVRTAWCATANNPKLSRELVRRLVWILLDPKMEDPSQRTGFRHANLGAWALAHRAEITHALLTILQAWIADGLQVGDATLGSYESWAAVMSGIMRVVGMEEDFMSNRSKLKETLDGESDEIRAFIGAWWVKHGTNKTGTKELYDLCKIKDLMLEAMGTGNDSSQKIRLGKLLQYQVSRVYEITVPDVTSAKADKKITVTVKSAGYNTQTNTKLYQLDNGKNPDSD